MNAFQRPTHSKDPRRSLMQGGWIGWLVLGILATIGTVVAIVGIAITPSDSPTPPSGICYTSCALVVETECGTGKNIGACLGWWECPTGSGGSSASLDTGVGAHPCLP